METWSQQNLFILMKKINWGQFCTKECKGTSSDRKCSAAKLVPKETELCCSCSGIVLDRQFGGKIHGLQ